MDGCVPVGGLKIDDSVSYPTRACINGPRSSAAIKMASVAACCSGLCCFDLDSSMMYAAASFRRGTTASSCRGKSFSNSIAVGDGGETMEWLDAFLLRAPTGVKPIRKARR